MVLHSNGCDLFECYGGLGYPFTNERIQFLKSQVVATVMQPSLKSLLASPKRDYLISNKGDKVPIDTLEGKTVALYFYEEGFSFDCSTEDIKMVYEEFGQNKSCFEVVLVYLYDTDITCFNTSEESFWNTFKSCLGWHSRLKIQNAENCSAVLVIPLILMGRRNFLHL